VFTLFAAPSIHRQMIFNLLVVLVAFLAVANAAQFNSTTMLLGGLFSTAPAVDTLNVAQYTGFWYQMYADELVLATIEKKSFCDTALYGAPNSEGHISVTNAAKIGSAAGTDYVITGYAYQDPDSTKQGELKVKFADGQGAPPVAAPYWVLELGPVNKADMYDYAIVSDNLSQFLFVLARDVTTFNSQYDAQVQASLKQLGFKGYKAPKAIYQGADCTYAQ
jgi:lipocalin